MSCTGDDLALLAELDDLLRRCDPVPARVIADAVAAFAAAHDPDEWWLLDAARPVR